MANALSAPQCVVTLGPASFHLAERLAEAGATAFRLNTSHMRLEAIVNCAERLLMGPANALPIILDLQGAKMRLGEFAERTVQQGDRVCFVKVSQASEHHIPLPHPEFFRQAQPGDTLRVDDDRMRFEIRSTSESLIETRALTDGALRPRKGVNVLEHPVALTDLSLFDAGLCDFARDHPGVIPALSFVATGEELDWVRRRTPERPVIAKVERREATANLRAIASTSDAVWICRGDLGAQLGPGEMAGWVAEVNPPEFACPFLMAGQVLEHLASHPSPTRSEVCHLYDLLRRGYAGIVLSDETAVGSHPELATRTASDLLRVLEGINRER